MPSKHLVPVPCLRHSALLATRPSALRAVTCAALGYPDLAPFLETMSYVATDSADAPAARADGPAAPANDFVCTLTCDFGPRALANLTSGARPAPPAAAIFAPPYAISNANQQLNISSKTLAVTARHADGTLEYDAHNLYGYMESVATARALRSIRGKRHFSFSRCAQGCVLGSRVCGHRARAALHRGMRHFSFSRCAWGQG